MTAQPRSNKRHNGSPTKWAVPKLLPELNRKTDAPRDIVLKLVFHEALMTMRFDRFETTPNLPKPMWTAVQMSAGLRYLQSLTHGLDPIHPDQHPSQLRQDYAALTKDQTDTLAAIFMIVCVAETNRALGPYVCLPGMQTDWYNETLDGFVAAYEGMRSNGAAKAWRKDVRLPELQKLVADEQAANEMAEAMLDLTEPTMEEASIAELDDIELEIGSPDLSNVIDLFSHKNTG